MNMVLIKLSTNVFFFRLADLAEEFELERAPSFDDLLSCIVNRDDVENIIHKPVCNL